MLEKINELFGHLVGLLEPILFMELNGFPLIVLILLIGSLTFTLYFKFINIRGFSHSINIIKGKLIPAPSNKVIKTILGGSGK